MSESKKERKIETSAQRREKTNQAASDLQKYIHSRDSYKESKLKELMCKCVYPDNALNFHHDSKCFGDETLYDETCCLDFIKTIVPESTSLSNDKM